VSADLTVDAVPTPSEPPTSTGPHTLQRSRLRFSDVLATGSVGLRTRCLRTALTATGIAIGIAALVAVLGISASSKADLIAQIDALGTNRLQVEPGTSFTGGTPTLTADALGMIRRIGPVEHASGIVNVGATVRRSDFVPSTQTGGVSVQATDAELATTIGAPLIEGRFLSAVDVTTPTIVLGSKAAATIGVSHLENGPMLYVGGHWFAVVGILGPAPLFPNLDSASFIGTEIAERYFGTDPTPSTVFVVAATDQNESVRAVLPATANPETPGEVQVSRPSDAIKAKSAVDDTLTALLLGLGGVALLVGGIGIANVMVIAVLERRTEIGVRRALGATKRHIRLQFLVEAVLMAALGGVIGLALGVLITAIYARVDGIVFAMPATSVAAGIGSALVVGALAGLSPAGRAARLNPADAIRPV
jgi:putative ABC transport system permease protein